MAKVHSNKLTAGDIQDLAVAVEQLTEETRLLRMSLDELRDDVVWAARQVLAAGDMVAPGFLSGRQRDPFVPNADLQNGHRSSPAINAAESKDYCCDEPRLTWSGDPDARVVACENCGYIVANRGAIVGFRRDQDFPVGKPTSDPGRQQASLFL